MAALTKAESKHMYSWWWDSHISPKNSKWLQENLTDMDTKVKLMIKLIEVDEDSFARRAEMYYKKRPELMKLVEEFYRAFRALAERYDHATGVIKHAHKTMAEAFPNQVPSIAPDDGSLCSSNDSRPSTPETSASVRAFCDPGNFQSGEELSFSNAKKGLSFHDADEKEIQIQKNEVSPPNAQVFSESERLERSETGIQELKEVLARLEVEKQAGLLEYQENLKRLLNLESDVSCAQEDSKGLHERASKAEAEVQNLKDSLAKLEGEREACLHQYQQCLDRISNLESNASHAEMEAQILREELVQLKTDKEAGLAKYMESLEKIANMENKLLLAEGKATAIIERACNAEKEVVALRETLDRTTKGKNAAGLQYQQCLEKIATLESEIALSHEEAARLKNEIDQGAAKLKGAEEQYHLLERSNKSMQYELESVSNRLGQQNQELSEKQKEMGRLWTCVQEERLRFVEVEAAFRALQVLHSQTEDELRSVAAELQKRVQVLKDMDIHNQRLQDEVQKVRNENKSLSELNLSSAALKENMQVENNKLQAELELRLDERNGLLQDIYCLKEELNVLNKKHQTILYQVELSGLQPESFGSSVKNLQDENSKLKESCQKIEDEIPPLLEKLGAMEKLVEKKAVLEHSLSELSAQLEDARGRVKTLEKSSELLMDEKSNLSSQLDLLTKNLEKLSKRNTVLENSLLDTKGELESLKVSSKNLEDSCQLLTDDKSILLNERYALESKLETAHQRLEELEKRHKELERSYSAIEEERESAFQLVEDLRNSLADEKHGHATENKLRDMQMAEIENKILLLQEAGQRTRGQLDKELDQAASSEFEICILRSILQDLNDTNVSLRNKCDKLFDTSKLSEELIVELEHENIEQHEEVKFLSEQIKGLRMGMFQLLKVLDVDLELACEDDFDSDQMILHRILIKLDDTRNSLCKAWDENETLLIEKSVLETSLGQLRQEISDLKAVITTLSQEFSTGNDQLSYLQKDMHKLLQSHEQLIMTVDEGNHKEEVLVTEVVNLRAKLLEMQSVCQDLKEENCRILEEKRSLMKTVAGLDVEKTKLEHDNSCLVVNMVTLDTLSLTLKNSVLERTEVIQQLAHETHKLGDDNDMLDDELKEVKAANSQLRLEIASKKDKLSQKETDFSEALAVQDDQGKLIMKLSERYDQQLKESESLRESMQKSSVEVFRILKKQKETDRTVEVLRSELKKARVEAELWETVAGTLFSELQTSSVREALFREKFSELSLEYVCVEGENHSAGLEVVELKERVGSLEGENSQIKAQLTGHVQALATLRDSVASLEAEIENVNDKDSASSHEPSKDEAVTTQTDLLNIAARVRAVERKVVETKKLTEDRSLKLLRSHSSRSRRGNSGRSSWHIPSKSIDEQPANRNPRHNSKHQKPTSSYETGEILMKDIMLDEASEASSRRKNRRGRYNSSENDDQILELWETMNQSGSIDLTVGRSHPSSESQLEKELQIDRITGPSEVYSNKKILERLGSDIQKLTNLQITVQDLKLKIVITESSNPTKGKGIEYVRVKEQLDEADRSITKLLNVNSRLMKNFEEGSPGSSSIDSSETGGSARLRKGKAFERARRCSEKMGRLQLEIQNIQFMLVKLDGSNKKSRANGTRVAERNTRILLKDYLYAGIRTPRRRKKTHFCGCIIPPLTSGE